MWHLFTQVNFSDKGSSSRECEEQAYMFFLDYLEESSELHNYAAVVEEPGGTSPSPKHLEYPKDYNYMYYTGCTIIHWMN